jgi:hypothetical protein
MHSRSLRTSSDARKGFDNIIIQPVAGDGVYSVGYLRLTE